MQVRLHTNTETYQIHNYEQGSRMHVGLCVLNIAWRGFLSESDLLVIR